MSSHDEIKRIAHAILDEYTRADPSEPHPDVLERFAVQLTSAVFKLTETPETPEAPPGE